ncbi:hypothetical protein KA005_55510 [bacterium]|nr:hypothetical protein [bacterium]
MCNEKIINKLVSIEKNVDSVTKVVKDISEKIESFSFKIDLDRIAKISKRFFLVFLALYIFFEIIVIVAFLSLIF